MATWKPTFVVGIDFGMTCTGVAYSSARSRWSEIKVVQRWPDHKGYLYDKYPSRVAYDASSRPRDWGACNRYGVELRVEREFKVYLHPAFKDNFETSPSHEEAVAYYIDYMTKLSQHIEQTFVNTIPEWSKQLVEYHFSIPTTWKSPTLTRDLVKYLDRAGFSNTSTRRIVVNQTEAEAAAVYAAKHYRKGDIIMVIDAGGATTDVNLLEVEAENPVARMRPLEKAEGENAGSIQIDVKAKRLIAERLEAMGVQTGESLFFLAEEMMEESNFEVFKRDYDGSNNGLAFTIDVPGRPGRRIGIEPYELKQFFDLVVDKIINMVKQQVTSLKCSRPQTHVKYLVLSGGLGSSPYIQARLRSEFAPTHHMTILVAEQPQLAVVKGLVMDRSQALLYGKPVYFGKRSRVSYGVLCRSKYNEKIHLGQKLARDQFTSEKYVNHQVDWLIKSGEILKEEGFKRRYSLKLGKGRELQPFHLQVVVSDYPAHQLPTSWKNDFPPKVCTVTGRFMAEDFSSGRIPILKRILWPSYKEHYEAKFDLKVIVGSTDLAFELLSLDGRSYSEGSARVELTWDDVPIEETPLVEADDMDTFPTPAGRAH